MMRAVIIDDEFNSLRSLELLITQFVPDLKVVATSSDPGKGIDLVHNYRPDIVFLDIHMPSMNGFELLEHLDFRDFHLIFTTAHSEYGLKAIKQSAVDYLLKPVDLEELEKAVERIKVSMQKKSDLPEIIRFLKQLHDLQDTKITIPVKNGFEHLVPNDIVYIEANSNNSLVTCLNGETMTSYKILKDYELMLCKENRPFIRINNSYIININHVTSYLREDGGYAVMQRKKTIPISKLKKDQFFKAVNFFSQ